MPKSKKSILKGIASLRMRIKEHELKIKEVILTKQNEHLIAHWEKEIRAFQQQIAKLKRLAKR